MRPPSEPYNTKPSSVRPHQADVHLFHLNEYFEKEDIPSPASPRSALNKPVLSAQAIEVFGTLYNAEALVKKRRWLIEQRKDYDLLLAHTDATLVQLLINQKNLKNLKTFRNDLALSKKASSTLDGLAAQLSVALDLSRQQFYLNALESRVYPQKKIEENILKYQLLLELINAPDDANYLTLPGWNEQVNALWPTVVDEKEEPWKIWIQGKWKAYNRRRIQGSRKLLSKVNDFRGDYVWTGALIKAILDLLSKTYEEQKERIKLILQIPGAILTYLSLSIRYTRFLLNLLVILKHIISHPWMKKDEKNIAKWTRLCSQWEQRKYSIFIEGMWSIGNTVNNFCLTPGPATQVIVTAMLSIELIINYIEWCAAKKRHIKAMALLDTRLQASARKRDDLLKEKNILEAKIFALRGEKSQLQNEATLMNKGMTKSAYVIHRRSSKSSNNTALKKLNISLPKKASMLCNMRHYDAEIAKNNQLLAVLEQKLAPIHEEILTLERIKATRERAWRFQTMRYTQEVATMVVAISAFGLTMISALATPMTLPAVLILGGPILSFSLTAFSGALAFGIDRAELKETIKNVREEFNTIIKAHTQLTLVSLNQLKELFVQEMRHEVDKAWKGARMRRAIGMYLSIPMVYFTSMFFLPFWMGISATIPFIALAVATYCLIWHRHTVQKQQVEIIKGRIEEQLKGGAPCRWYSEPENVHGFFMAMDKRKMIAPYLKPNVEPSVGYCA